MNEYFEQKNISSYGDRRMIFKTIFMLTIYITPFILIYSGFVTEVIWLFILYVVISVGMSGIGMGIMHDANHGSYSENKKVNKYLGLTLNLVGANSKVWKLQHNVLHHTYTNIEGADDDINVPGVLRFSPHGKQYWIHRFQFLYAWIFYGLSTLFWMTSKDYVRITRFRSMGLVKGKGEFRRILVNITLWKIFYFSYALVIPILVLPFSPWVVVSAFVMMHFITGLVLSLVFQTAHVMPDTKYPLPDQSGKITEDWWAHQLATTCNYAPNSWILSWMIGGLNFQIEHHLLPKVCHIHYKALSPIIKKTAEEFNLPYITKPNFIVAVSDHLKMLYQLGKPVK